MSIQNKITCNTIILKNSQILLNEYKHNGKPFYAFPNTEYLKGSEDDCVKDLLDNKLHISFKQFKKVYEYYGNDSNGIYFLVMSNLSLFGKKEETQEPNADYTAVWINSNKLEEINLLPLEIKQQLIEDLKDFSKNVSKQVKTIYEE